MRPDRETSGCEKQATPIDDIDFVSSSRYRIAVLNRFAESASLTRHEVRESVDASRSTVRRTLEALLERGLLESSTDGYRITARGETLADGIEQLIETTRITEAYEPLFRWIPWSALDIDPTWLADGTMTVSTETNPYAPAQAQTETVRDAATFRGFLPAIELEGTRLVHERITTGALTAQIVVTETMCETIRSEPYADLFREQIDSDGLDLFVSPDSIPFYLGLPDDGAVEIGGMDDEGIPRALFRSERPELRRWGERTFETYRDDAARLEATDL